MLRQARLRVGRPLAVLTGSYGQHKAAFSLRSALAGPSRPASSALSLLEAWGHGRAAAAQDYKSACVTKPGLTVWAFKSEGSLRCCARSSVTALFLQETQRLLTEPVPGISAAPSDDNLVSGSGRRTPRSDAWLQLLPSALPCSPCARFKHGWLLDM